MLIYSITPSIRIFCALLWQYTELLGLQRSGSLHHCEGLGNVPFQWVPCSAAPNKRRLGVAIIDWLPEEDIVTLADELLKRWRLCHEKCADGILMLYVNRHKDLVISWGKGVEPLINAKVVSSIYPICRELLQKEKLAVAIDRCTSFVTKRLTGVILPSQETPQM